MGGPVAIFFVTFGVKLLSLSTFLYIACGATCDCDINRGVGVAGTMVGELVGIANERAFRPGFVA